MKIRFPGIRGILEKSLKDYETILQRERKTEMSEENKHKELVEKIVDSIENKKRLDKASYQELVENHPQVKSILDELINQVRMFSIYDSEPNKVNFNYNAYLHRIEQLINIEK